MRSWHLGDHNQSASMYGDVQGNVPATASTLTSLLEKEITCPICLEVGALSIEVLRKQLSHAKDGLCIRYLCASFRA